MEEVSSFGTGRHLRTINAPVTFVYRSRSASTRRRRWPGVRRRKVGGRRKVGAALIMRIAIPTETKKDEESDYISHRGDVFVAP